MRLTCECDGNGGPRGEPAVTETEARELEETLIEVVQQACLQDDGTLDSCAHSAYADALRRLAERGKIAILRDAGRRVIARWREEA